MLLAHHGLVDRHVMINLPHLIAYTFGFCTDEFAISCMVNVALIQVKCWVVRLLIVTFPGLNMLVAGALYQRAFPTIIDRLLACMNMSHLCLVL